jgi:hypothetical protein
MHRLVRRAGLISLIERHRMLDDRRDEARIAPQICAKLAGRDEVLQVVSLSNSGCRLSPAPAGLAVDQPVEVILSLPNWSKLRIPGVVRSQNANGVGISFSDIPLSKMVALASFIITRKSLSRS